MRWLVSINMDFSTILGVKTRTSFALFAALFATLRHRGVCDCFALYSKESCRCRLDLRRRTLPASWRRRAVRWAATAISWTYIIIAELLNRQGGLGALIYVKARQGQLEKVFAILIVIILIGFLQDRIFVYMDRRLFPHKYAKKRINGIKEVEYGLMAILLAITLAIIIPAIIPSTVGMMGNLATILAITGLVVSLYGEYRLRKASVEAA